MFLLSAASYFLLPLNETVIVASPSPTAVMIPYPFTSATSASSDWKDKLPTLDGIRLTTGLNSSPTFKSAVPCSTMISVGILFTVTLTIVEFSA